MANLNMWQINTVSDGTYREFEWHRSLGKYWKVVSAGGSWYHYEEDADTVSNMLSNALQKATSPLMRAYPIESAAVYVEKRPSSTGRGLERRVFALIETDHEVTAQQVFDAVRMAYCGAICQDQRTKMEGSAFVCFKLEQLVMYATIADSRPLLIGHYARPIEGGACIKTEQINDMKHSTLK